MDEQIVEKALAIGSNIVESNSRKFLKKRHLYPALEKSVENPQLATVMVGLRGTGKTVLLSQLAGGRKYAFLQMDYAPLKGQDLYDVLAYLYKVKGADFIVLDEFQDCMDFSSVKAFFEEAKGEVSLVITGSSAVALYPPELTRRVETLTLEPLSFREYLFFKQGVELPWLSLAQVLEGEWRGLSVYSPFIPEYMRRALPYLLETDAGILPLIDKIVRHDLVVFRKISQENISEVEKILLSTAVSTGETSFGSLSNKSGVEKTQVMRYFSLLKDALLLKEVPPAASSTRQVFKERKFYLTPPFRQGICAELGREADKGMLREEFFVQHAFKHSPKFLPGKGMPDFAIGKHSFEVGGPGKDKRQKPDYLVVDGRTPSKGELPLVAFGFLY
ncbi:ATP-binding protein [Candidatus Micrarchaeota archaeon]|nr:ATP-binding protein [Candidatus Micrarchaeota archaeon]